MGINGFRLDDRRGLEGQPDHQGRARLPRLFASGRALKPVDGLAATSRA